MSTNVYWRQRDPYREYYNEEQHIGKFSWQGREIGVVFLYAEPQKAVMTRCTVQYYENCAEDEYGNVFSGAMLLAELLDAKANVSHVGQVFS